MCGIVGGISHQPFAFLTDAARFDRAVDSLAHRGPDDRGAWLAADHRTFLGHRRLSIIDLAGGHQPLTDETGRRRLVYNGEIYNFRALRRELEAGGHAFRTHSDGETIVHAYEDDARGFVERLQGMFAVAILDECDGSLTLARDRNGIKPLYYHFDGQGLIFASELKAILALLDKRPAIDPYGLREYLRWKYVPAPATIYRNVFELPAAHVLRAGAAADGSLRIEVRRYWQARRDGERITDEREAVETLDRKLQAAVECHLESDVEVGALLSGGVDSSLVVAMASRISGRRIKTFCVGFREPGFDQLPFARVLAEHCRTEHFEEYVDLDPAATVPRLVRHFDQPFADSSALACYRVCEVAAKHVKVALTGDGGDETFAGYRRYDELRQRAQRDSAARRWLCRALFTAGAAVLSPEAKFLRRVRAGSHPPLLAHEDADLMCGEWLLNRLLTPAYRAGDGEDVFETCRREAMARGDAAEEVAQYVDSRTYLPGDILQKVDRTSMAWSLECRVPLLDHTISEFGASLATDLKIRDGEGKYILKRVAERYVPSELLYRKKRGFRVPIRRWFKRGLLDETAKLLDGGSLASHGVLDPRGLRWVLRSQRHPWMNLSSLLWALLILEHWARASLDGGQ